MNRSDFQLSEYQILLLEIIVSRQGLLGLSLKVEFLFYKLVSVHCLEFKWLGVQFIRVDFVHFELPQILFQSVICLGCFLC